MMDITYSTSISQCARPGGARASALSVRGLTTASPAGRPLALVEGREKERS
jgi:hypothetical protein